MALFGYPVARGLSLDHLIRASEKGFGDRQPKRLCCLEIDDESKFGRLLDRRRGPCECRAIPGS
jgi:hypothetical protein